MRIVIVGAGMSGLVAARELEAAGAGVTLLDKGRSVGGRMATRRIGDAVVDHGAQFFTVRTPAFRARVDDWVERGLVEVWTHGFRGDDGHPRYVATGGMNSLAKDLATGLGVECSTMAFAIRPTDGDASRWSVVIDDGTSRAADAVIVTTPLPQAFALLADAHVELDETLMRTDYDRTIALLATFTEAVELPGAGGVQGPDDDVAFVADNVAKGVSATPAITLHASAAWSEAHWDDDVTELRRDLLALLAPWTGGVEPTETEVKKWRFATPRASWPEPCWVAEGGTLVLAGDAFDGPRLEAAHNSGLAAAHALVS